MKWNNYKEGNGLRKKVRDHKIAGIVIAVCMVVLGILILIEPVAMSVGLAYLITIGLLAFGIFSIVAYIRTPADFRNGWTLANGIVYCLLAVLILEEALGSSIGAVSMMSTFAFMIGFFALIGGIMQITSCSTLRGADTGFGWMLASGIMNLILGVLIILSPIAGWFTIQYVFSIYLIVGGVALFAEACSGRFGYRP